MLSFSQRKSLNKRKTQKGGASSLRRVGAKVLSTAEQALMPRHLPQMPLKAPVAPASNIAQAALLDPLLPIGAGPLPRQGPITALRAGPKNVVLSARQPPRSTAFTKQRRTTLKSNRQSPFNQNISAKVNGTRQSPFNQNISAKVNGTRQSPFNQNISVKLNGTRIIPRRRTFKRRMHPPRFFKTRMQKTVQELLSKREKRIHDLLKMRKKAGNEISANLIGINASMPPNKILSRILGTSRSSLRSLKDQLITIKFINKRLGSHKVDMTKIIDFILNPNNNLGKLKVRGKLTDLIFPIKKNFRRDNKLTQEAQTIRADLVKRSKQSMKKIYPAEILARKQAYLDKLKSRLSKENFEKIKVDIEHVIEENEMKWNLFIDEPKKEDFDALKAILNDVDNMIPVIKRTNILKTELVSTIRCCFSSPEYLKIIRQIMYKATIPNRRFNQQRILDLKNYLEEILVIRKQMLKKIEEAEKTAKDESMFKKLINDIEKMNMGFELFIKFAKKKAVFSRSRALARAGMGGAQTQSPENVQAIFDESVTMLNYFIEDFAIETSEDLIETKELESQEQPAIIYDASYEDFKAYNDKFIELKDIIKEDIITFLANDVDEEKPKTLSNLTYGIASNPVKSPYTLIMEKMKMTPEQQATAEAIERSMLAQKKEGEQ